MSKNAFAAFQSVRVKEIPGTEEQYERVGQVGVYVGPGDEPGESSVKFDAADPAAPQEYDTFPDDALEGL